MDGFDQRLAAMDRPDRLRDLVERQVLEQVTARAGPDGLEEILFLVADRQHDDLGARRDLLHRPAGLDSAAAGHPDVHQDDIRERFASLLDGLGSVTGLADQLDVVLLVQDHLEGRGGTAHDRQRSSRESARDAPGSPAILRQTRGLRP